MKVKGVLEYKTMGLATRIGQRYKRKIKFVLLKCDRMVLEMEWESVGQRFWH